MTQTATTFLATVRENVGKKDAKAPANSIVGNISGHGNPSTPIYLTRKDVTSHLEHEGESGLVYLSIPSEKQLVPVLFSEIQTHPVTGELRHVSFQKVSLTEKIETEVPIEVRGEFSIPDATFVLVVNELTIEALPTDIPENVVLDLGTLTEIGQSLTHHDLSYDKAKITIMLPEGEDKILVGIAQEQRAEEVPEETAEVTPEVQPSPTTEQGEE
jgi:large subunit ribosomal protein L25